MIINDLSANIKRNKLYLIKKSCLAQCKII